MTAREDAGQRGVAPVGRLFEIAHGDQRAVITEAGASLRVYEVGPRPVVEPFDGADTVPIGAQGEILAPWPNRTVDGSWRWGSTRHQLSITEPERGHALHGLVRTLAWTPVENGVSRIDLATTLLAHPGWPFPLQLTVTYALGPAGLTCRLMATNIGRARCPYGAATHPYLAIPGGTDEAVLRIPAATWLATDDRLAPTERRATAGTPYDFDGSVPVGAREVDNAFTDLERAPDGRVEASLRAPDGRTTVLWGDASVRWWQLFTGDALPSRWRRAVVALEPMTCGPDALNTGDDLAVLDPGETHRMTWGLRLM
ncbi:MAG TPA: aldose 1-epimerase family protein [Acidimicrobiales bacterium]|nr:aldose 1-epimerase family protein [Acidimicrobiales bacterium]